VSFLLNAGIYLPVNGGKLNTFHAAHKTVHFLIQVAPNRHSPSKVMSRSYIMNQEDQQLRFEGLLAIIFYKE
jgi:hypothetical protein